MKTQKNMRRRTKSRACTKLGPRSFKTVIMHLKRMPSCQQRAKLVRNGNDKFIRALAPHIHRTLPIVSELISAKGKRDLRKFANGLTSMNVRRKMLQQRGGGLANILGAILPLAGALISAPIASTFKEFSHFQ